MILNGGIAALPNLPYGSMLDAAENGSPALLNVVGRAFGLGQAEQAALTGGNVPGWVWLVVGVGVGVMVGARVQKAWPGQMPDWLSG